MTPPGPVRLASRFLLLLLSLITPVRGDAASFATSLPQDLSQPVPPGSPVQFDFSAPMQTSATRVEFYAVTQPFTAVVATWSDDARTLVYQPVPNFPPNTIMTWWLQGVDLDGNGLPPFPVPVGSFATGPLNPGPETDPIRTLTVAEVLSYRQNWPARPMVDATVPWSLVLSADFPDQPSATRVVVWRPDGLEVPLLQDAIAGGEFSWGEFGETSQRWNVSGAYTFVITTPDSIEEETVQFPPDLSEPAVPVISNLPELQTANPSLPIPVRWESPPIANKPDFILVAVRGFAGGVFSTPEPGLPGALTGGATAVEIPAGTLLSGSTYTVSVVFLHGRIRTAGPRLARALRGSSTEGELKTVVDPVHPRVAVDRPAYDDSAPIRSSPASPVVFTFTRPMNPLETSVTFVDRFTGRILSEVILHWSTDQRTLTCNPTPAFPPDSVIAWEVTGRDTSGAALMDPRSGSFAVGALNLNPKSSLRLVRTLFHRQTSTGLPTLHPERSWSFFVHGVLASNQSANRLALTTPRGKEWVLEGEAGEYEPFEFWLDQGGTDRARLEEQFPEGAYVLTVSGRSTSMVRNIGLPANLAVSAVPRVVNFDSAQRVDGDLPFPLTWDPFPDARETDTVYVAIEARLQEIFHTPEPGQEGALPGTATSVTVPAGLLARGSEYLGRVAFLRSRRESDPDFASEVLAASVTEFAISTLSNAVSRPLALGNPTMLPDGTVRIPVQTPPTARISILWSDDLGSASWNLLLQTNSPEVDLLILDEDRSGRRHRFYRAELE